MCDHRTKRLLGRTLAKLMETTPFSKISVQSICDSSGIRRQTFYYHFKDKFDLIAWVYCRNISEIIQSSANISWDKVMLNIFRAMEQNRGFFQKSLEDSSQNSLRSSMEAYGVVVYRTLIKERLCMDEIDDSMSFAIEYHVCACVQLTCRWLLHGKNISAEEHCDHIMKACPRELVRIITVNDPS